MQALSTHNGNISYASETDYSSLARMYRHNGEEKEQVDASETATADTFNTPNTR